MGGKRKSIPNVDRLQLLRSLEEISRGAGAGYQMYQRWRSGAPGGGRGGRGGPKRFKRRNGLKISARTGVRSTRSRTKTQTKKKKTLKSRINALEKDLKDDMSYKHFRELQVKDCNGTEGKASMDYISAFDSDSINTAVATLQVSGSDVDVTTLPENTQIDIQSVWCEAEVSNTFDMPCTVDIYAVTSKTNTGTTSQATFFTAQENLGFGGAISDAIDAVSYPGLCPDFMKNYKILGHSKARLRGGDVLKLSATLKDFKWSHDDYIQQGSVAFMKYKNVQFMFRLRGDICYDSLNGANISYIKPRVSAVIQTNFTVEYSGTTAAREYQFINNLSSITGDGQVAGPNVINIVE